MLNIISIIYLTIGVLILLLGILIFRENPNKRINRTTGTMMFFASLAPLMGGFGILINAYATPIDMDMTVLNRLFLIWEFFFPQLLVFALIFPTEKRILRDFPQITLLMYIPHLIHFFIIMIFRSPESIVSLIKLSQINTHVLLQPLVVVMNLLLALLSYFYEFHTNVFAIVNLIYVVLAIFIMYRGYLELNNPLQRKQVGLVLWGIRVSVGLYAISYLLPRIIPFAASTGLNYLFSILALIIGPGSIALAIIKYQFLDIRLILRRGIIFSVTSGLLVGIYLIIYDNTKRFITGLLGIDIPIIEVLFLILAVIMFYPVLSAIEEGVEKYFHQGKKDYRQLLQTLSRDILHIIDASQLQEKIVIPLKEYMLLDSAFVFIRQKENSFVTECARDSDLRNITFPPTSELIEQLHTIHEAIKSDALIARLTNSVDAAKLRKLNARLIIPLRHHDNLIGMFIVGSKASGTSFTSEEMTLLLLLADQMTFALENIELYEEKLEKQRIQEEISVAREIQRMLLPHSIPAGNSFEISALNIPSKEVGGDYYDFVELNEHHIGIAIGDISGKGVPGALLMSNLQATLRAAAYGHESSAEVTRLINRQITRTTSTEKFATFFYGIFDSSKHTFTYTNAGHNYPIIRKKDGTCKYLMSADLIIGVQEEYAYREHTIKLDHGDVLVLYTDGITEAINSQRDEFSDQHLIDTICCHEMYSAEELRNHIYDEVLHFTGEESQYDDITLIVLRVLG
ncbi:SpoIIE family protein phosphatase [candidate division KSB1 bacterium]|nr:SpoIIE family protein phosphatase [candidate division KSB1 bacterium]